MPKDTKDTRLLLSSRSPRPDRNPRCRDGFGETSVIVGHSKGQLSGFRIWNPSASAGNQKPKCVDIISGPAAGQAPAASLVGRRSQTSII